MYTQTVQSSDLISADACGDHDINNSCNNDESPATDVNNSINNDKTFPIADAHVSIEKDERPVKTDAENSINNEEIAATNDANNSTKHEPTDNPEVDTQAKLSFLPPPEISIPKDTIDEELNNGFLYIPKYRQGTEIAYTNGGPRNVPSTCAICLADYKAGDTVIWSGNKECYHVFHDECIISWLLSINDNQEYICPCCRQTFLCDKESHSNSTTTVSSSTSLRSSFGPYAYLQGHTRPSLAPSRYVQSPREGNEIPSNSDTNNNSDDDSDRGFRGSVLSRSLPNRQVEISDGGENSASPVHNTNISSERS